jgi:HK97 family phage major capsid protein
MASPTTFQYLLSLKDGEGRPYFLVDPATGLLQIAGKPLYINNAMPSYATASTKAVLFGDFSRAYAYLNGSGAAGMRIRVLLERYVDVFENAAIVYTRLGAATLVSGAVKALETASS